MHKVKAHGSADAKEGNLGSNVGYNRKLTSGGLGFNKTREHWMNRVHYLSEVKFAYIVPATKSQSVGAKIGANYYKYAKSANAYMIQSEATYDDIYATTASGWWGASGNSDWPPTYTTRYVKRVERDGDSIKEILYNSDAEAVEATELSWSGERTMSDDETNAGYYKGYLVRTNPYTGKFYGSFAGKLLIRIGRREYIGENGEYEDKYVISGYRSISNYGGEFVDYDNTIYAIYHRCDFNEVFRQFFAKDSNYLVRGQ